MSAYAPFNVSYTQTEPYLTVAEYQAAPEAIDITALSYGASALSNVQQLAQVIARASSLLDAMCFGAYGTLNATSNTENGLVTGDRRGFLRIHPKFWPVLEVSAFSYGTTGATSASVTPAGNIWIEPGRFILQPAGVVGLGFGSLIGVYPGVEYFCQWTYVNGWPNSTFAASVAAGAQTFVPSSLVGIYPGTALGVIDQPGNEQIVVASTYIPGTLPVPTVSPFVNAHQVGATLSNLPQVAKQAAILITTALIKARGNDALVIDSLEQPSKNQTLGDQGLGDDMAMARECIKALKSMTGGMW
jgi:hypothetical protein